MKVFVYLGYSLPTLIVSAIMVWLLSLSANAYELVYHSGSLHTDLDPHIPWQEINPGLGFSWQEGEGLRYEAGVYLNSYADVSLYALTDLMVFSPEWGVFLGVASGYQEDFNVPEHGVTLIGGVVYHGDGYTNRISPLYDSRDGTIGFVQSFSF